jgi:cell fate regulator YaaT (PSP1 superfamily)
MNNDLNQSEHDQTDHIPTPNSENIDDITNESENLGESQPEEGRVDESQLKSGDILTFIRVRFPGNAKSFPFLIGERKLSYGQKVLAMSDRGIAVGYINSFPYQLVFQKEMLPIRSIIRVATEEDLANEQEIYHNQTEAEKICIDLIHKYELDMNLTHVEYTQFGKKVVFYFTAPARVDFRSLVKDLVATLKLRIELRQISVRDRTAAIGGIGPCGRQLCCSSFLNQYGNVNIKMAKNQDLTLNFNKLNGVCGQLKCCLQYEDEVYTQKRRILPKVGRVIKTVNGDIGKVQKLHILIEQFDLLTTEGVIKRYSVNQFDSEINDEKIMPERFDHITFDTNNVIGLNQYLTEKAKTFEASIDELKNRQFLYAENIFLKHFGERTTLEAEEYQISKDELVKTQIKVQEASAEMILDSQNNFHQESKEASFPLLQDDDSETPNNDQVATNDKQNENHHHEKRPAHRRNRNNYRHKKNNSRNRPPK